MINILWKTTRQLIQLNSWDLNSILKRTVNMSDFTDFISVVQKYAKAYETLEELQKDKKIDFVPEKGDQKTGVIGEAYVYEYLKSKLNPKNISFGETSQKGWDIKVHNKKYQVKTISGFSEGKVISPIHDGWDELYLLKLNKKFIPEKVLHIIKGTKSITVVKNKKFPIIIKDKISLGGTICKMEDETENFLKVLNLNGNNC